MFDIKNEDRLLNQYWYSAATIDTLCREIELRGRKVAFLSTPSLFFSLKNEMVKAEAVLFEFDKQFGEKIASEATMKAVRHLDEVLEGTSGNNGAGNTNESELCRLRETVGEDAKKKHFCYYDYNKSEQIPMQYMGYFDYVVVDPPFITQEVWEQYGKTIKFILDPKSPGGPDSCGEGGQVLFTSVMENHCMLENVADRRLYVSWYKPSIPHLTYQYYIFTSYNPPEKSPLMTLNPEIHIHDAEEERSSLLSIQQMNDMRQSEIAFALQMKNRNRTNEPLLPPQKNENMIEYCTSGPNTTAPNPLLDKPIGQMRWSTIPAGLTEYANGGDGDEGELEAVIVDYGEEYNNLTHFRELLDEFKRGVDTLQKHCNTLLLAHTSMEKKKKKAKEIINEIEKNISENVKCAWIENEITIQKEEIAKSALLARMETIKKECIQIISLSSPSTLKDTSSTDPLIVSMGNCINAYTVVPIVKSDLQELAADATRQYKSPIFGKQTELLRKIKALKVAAINDAKEREMNKECS
eukprot:Tbor_TRINITY_DN5333_c0_g7::TRINITY_DN5333_c0_g7_i1::g.4763::m.4763